ncbi:MAG: hypothetical protein E3J96_06520, partial [Sulfurovum sp.]
MTREVKKSKIETSKQRQNRHKAMEAATVLDKIKHDFKEPPKAMDYFYDLYERVHCKQQPLHNDKV